jgi:hypothetical protein
VRKCLSLIFNNYDLSNSEQSSADANVGAKEPKKGPKIEYFSKFPIFFVPRNLKKHLETITIALGLMLGTAKASWDSAKEHE